MRSWLVKDSSSKAIVTGNNEFESVDFANEVTEETGSFLARRCLTFLR